MVERRLYLPAELSSRSDVAKAVYELDNLHTSLLQAVLRQANVPLPVISPALQKLAEVNACDLTDERHRLLLISFLSKVKDLAPVVHMYFASEPSLVAVAHVVRWLRHELSKYTLLEVGVQPSIIAGCRLRTTNKHFDFSLRNQLDANQSVLRQKIGEFKT